MMPRRLEDYASSRATRASWWVIVTTSSIHYPPAIVTRDMTRAMRDMILWCAEDPTGLRRKYARVYGYQTQQAAELAQPWHEIGQRGRCS